MFRSEFDRGVEVVHKIFHGLDLFGGAYKDQEDVIYESLPEGDLTDKSFPDGFFVTPHEEVGIWWGILSSQGYATKLDKMPVHE